LTKAMNIGDVSISANFRNLEEREFRELALSFEQRISIVSPEIYRAHAKIEYSFEEGSLKSRVKAILAGSLILYGAVSEYPSFRDGVIKLHHDAITFGHTIVQEFKSVTGVKDKDIGFKRTMSRDVNRLYRITTNIDALERPTSPFEKNIIREKIITDIAGVCLANPYDEAIWNIINILPRDKIPGLPKTSDEAIAVVRDRKRQVRSSADRAPRGETDLPTRTFRRQRKYQNTFSV
jgi:hypothetical protein